MTSLPYTITAPGIYCLDRSTNVGGTGITIEANDVTVDLKGYTLEVTAAGVVSSGRSNITVRNGTIRGGDFGVALRGSAGAGHVVERMRVEASSESGIVVHGRGGVVRNNVVIGVGDSRSGDKSGISVGLGAGIRVSDNEVLDMRPSAPGEGGPIDLPGVPAGGDAPMPGPGQVDAITVADAPGAVIERNVVSNTALLAAELPPVGIHIYRSAGSTVPMTAIVARNRVANIMTGIHSSGASSLYLGNTVSGAGTPFSGGVMAGSTNVAF
jgi:hypothetical protein